MRNSRRRPEPRALALGSLVMIALLASAAPEVASASNWVVPLARISTAEATAQSLPAAPTGATASCSELVGGTIKVTWSSVTLATGYSISESSTSASGAYSVVASGVTGTSWTSPTLSPGNYWFEVAASIGTYWLGPDSSATSESTIAVLSLTCTQP